MLTDKQKYVIRYGQLEQERQPWFAQWRDISTYLLPRNGRYFVTDKQPKSYNNIYDNTGSQALQILVAGLMGGLTSPARPWFRLATADQDLNQYAPVRLWLSTCTRLMLNVFQRSNTYFALMAAYKELAGFGTSATVIGDDYDSVIHHFPLTVGEYCIDQDWRGKPCTMYRKFQKTVVEIVKEFGIDNVSYAVKNMYDNGNLSQMIPILHIVEPRADRDASKIDAKNMAWKSIYYEESCDKQTPLRESGYKEFPVLAPRWELSGGDVYGNSPAMIALGDIKQLQQQQIRKSQGIDYMTNPPLQVPSMLKNMEINRLPGGITFYDPANPAGSIKTMFDVNINLQHLREDIVDVRQRIRNAFFADLFLMLSSQDNTRMTATEVAERHEEKMLMLGPVLERLHNELLDPLVSVTFNKMLAGGILPPPPEELQGKDLNVEMISVLAQAQRAISTNGIDRFVNNIGAIAHVKPNVLDNFNEDEWANIYSDMLGVDPELIVPSDKVALVRKQRAEQQAAAQQSAMANQAADTAQKLGGTVTQGGGSNALDDVTRAFSGYN